MAESDQLRPLRRLIHISARTVITAGIVAAILLLLLAFALPQDFRRVDPWYLRLAFISEAVRDFLIHFGVGLLLCAVAAWLLGMRRRMVAALIPALIILLPAASRYLPSPPPLTSASTLRVMSMNLLWLNPSIDDVIAEIDEAGADVVLFQEYAPHFHAAFTQKLSQYPHRLAAPRSDAYGIAIYSRLPFRGDTTPDLALGPFGHPQMRAVVEFAGSDVAIYNVHLLGPHRVAEIAGRRAEFADLLDHLRRETLPLIMGGDFNCTVDTPQGWALNALGLHNAHDEAGYGLGCTWPVAGWMRHVPLPGFRIDHVYVRGSLQVTSCRRGYGVGSDHMPVIADIAPVSPPPGR